MKDDKIKEIFTNYTYILIDRREKKLHIKEYYDKLNIHNEFSTVDYGDYSIKIISNPILKNKEDIIFNVSVERKASLDELANNLTKGKTRFMREMERCKKDEGNMIIMIENATYMDIIQHNYKSDLSPKSFLALLHTIYDRYDVPFIFIEEEASSLFVYNYLKYYCREWLKNI